MTKSVGNGNPVLVNANETVYGDVTSSGTVASVVSNANVASYGNTAITTKVVFVSEGNGANQGNTICWEIVVQTTAGSYSTITARSQNVIGRQYSVQWKYGNLITNNNFIGVTVNRITGSSQFVSTQVYQSASYVGIIYQGACPADNGSVAWVPSVNSNGIKLSTYANGLQTPAVTIQPNDSGPQAYLVTTINSGNNFRINHNITQAGNTSLLWTFMSILASNGFVGINNTSPAYQLDVAGNSCIRSSAGAVLTLAGSNTTTTMSIAVDGINSNFDIGTVTSTGEFTSDSVPRDTIIRTTNSASAVRIANGTNTQSSVIVASGATSVNGNLTVFPASASGGISIVGPLINRTGTGCQFSMQCYPNAQKAYIVSATDTNSTANIAHMINKGGNGTTYWTPLYMQASNGFVGINNTAPGYQLDVIGNSNFNGNVYVSPNSNARLFFNSGFNACVENFQGTADWVLAESSVARRLVVRPGGRIEMNVTTLAVSGNATFTGSVTAGTITNNYTGGSTFALSGLSTAANITAYVNITGGVVTINFPGQPGWTTNSTQNGTPSFTLPTSLNPPAYSASYNQAAGTYVIIVGSSRILSSWMYQNGTFTLYNGLYGTFGSNTSFQIYPFTASWMIY